MTSDRDIFQTVRGYETPFTSQVFQDRILVEPILTKEDKTSLNKLINNLINKGAVSLCEPVEDQFLSPYFTVFKPNGDKRFILNLKKLNMFIIASSSKWRIWK